jgi:exosortase
VTSTSQPISRLDQAGPARRWLGFALWLLFAILLLTRPILALIHYALNNSDASHILLIPFITAWLLFTERQRIFSRVSFSPVLPAPFIFLGIALAFWAHAYGSQWQIGETLAAYTLALSFMAVAGFSLFFGPDALRKASFPFLFLLLGVPLPDFLLSHVIYWLQSGSAAIAGALFDLTGVPVLREGFVFHLPHLSIEVASECSGIRSSMALLILALFVAHFSLRAFWRKTVFIAFGLLVMIVKNGVRIVTLTLLANYVNPDFLVGRLHNEGGVVFFLLGLLLLVPVLWFLQRGEKKSSVPFRIDSMKSKESTQTD